MEQTARDLPPRKFVVTGASGFIGSHLAKLLADAGHDVVAMGRNAYRVPIRNANLKFHRVDLASAPIESLASWMRGCDVVFHAAAFSAPWGDPNTFDRCNVTATENVLQSCDAASVRRLVHVSSSAVQFDGKDRVNIDESHPMPASPKNDYVRTKQIAEAVVRNHQSKTLETIVIRARAVFGAGDNSLLPRILSAADRGTLIAMADDRVLSDLTYIDNFLFALLLAIQNGQSGDAFTITNDEPVALWPFVRDILARTGRRSNLFRPGRHLCMLLASLIEFNHRVLQRTGEPTLTRYSVGLLSRTSTFDINRAKTQLGYRPLVSMPTAVDRTLDAMQKRDETHADTTVDLQLFTTGYTVAPAGRVQRGASLQTSW
ncbi:MAG: NAD-dependent epimerase/dehydratase family protein, partial [Planctomycetota bacterium]